MINVNFQHIQKYLAEVSGISLQLYQCSQCLQINTTVLNKQIKVLLPITTKSLFSQPLVKQAFFIRTQAGLSFTHRTTLEV